MNLPDLQVLINGTDVTSYVLAANGYTVSRGRQDWQGAVTAGELTLTLNNSDGRFTPGAATLATGWDTTGWDIGPWDGAGTIVVDAEIVLKETVAGVTYTRFTGYVKSWPVAWPATVSTFATIQVTATDAQARAERHPLRSMLEEEVLLDSPAAYYTLSEAEGSTSAGDTSGSQAPPLAIAGTGAVLTFGTATSPETVAPTAIQFAGGQYLAGALPSTPAAVEFWINTTTNDATSRAIYPISTSGTGAAIRLQNGQLYYQLGGPYGAVADGVWHHVVWNGTDLWLDGITVATVLAPGTSTPAWFGGTRDVTMSGFIGSGAHLAFYPSTLSSARIADHYAAGHSGLAGEPSTARMTRLAGYANIPVGTLDASLTTVPGQSTTGQGAMPAIQDVADAELGLVYIDGSGALTFHNRNRVPAKTAPDLTLTADYITPDVTPVVDDQQIVNYFEATASGNGAVQVAREPDSENAHGRYPDSRTYLVQTDGEALDRANWIVDNFAEPTVRFGTLTINLYKMTPAQAATVLNALELDCWLRVTGLGTQTPGGTTVDVVVQGWEETASAETWTIACNVVSHLLYTPVWILDTSSLDTDTRLYV